MSGFKYSGTTANAQTFMAYELMFVENIYCFILVLYRMLLLLMLCFELKENDSGVSPLQAWETKYNI